MIKTLAVRLAKVKAKKVCDTLDPVQAKALVNKLAATVAEMGAKTIGGTLHDEEGKALVDRTPDTPQEVKVRLRECSPRHCSTRWLTQWQK